MVVSVAGQSAAPACQICIPFPKKSAADFLIEADAAVLAREDPERPFHYAPVEILKGRLDGEKIELFLDSTTRRGLAANPERSVVLVKSKDGASDSWRRIGVADEDLGPVVRSVLKASVAWEKKPEERTAFFAKRLGHENDQVRALAHLEIARAPYHVIRDCAGALSREEIRAFLKNYQYVEWHALYILLLAQSEHPDDRKLIENSFDASARYQSTLRLAAWATAMVEIHEEAAIVEVEKRYFRNASRKPEELKAVIQALSVQGTNGHTHLRERIVESYGVLLQHHPAMVPQIFGDLEAWKRPEFAGEVSSFLAGNPQGLDFKTMLRLRAYAKNARKSAGGLR